jgi:hypothetical protein
MVIQEHGDSHMRCDRTMRCEFAIAAPVFDHPLGGNLIGLESR